MTTTDLPPDWLDRNNREALTLALEQCRAASKEECRQIDSMAPLANHKEVVPCPASVYSSTAS